jgi:hypothetical protein
MWRIFPTVADCQSYCDAAWRTLARTRAAANGNVLWDYSNGRRPVNISTLPDQAITPARFPLLGRNQATGKINMDSGWTTAWAEPRETADGQWAAPCVNPDDPNGQPEPAWPPTPLDI